MPRRIPPPCSRYPCPNRAAPGRSRCPDCQPKDYAAQDARRGSASSRGYGPDWRALRTSVLRGEPLCRHCKAAHRVTLATEVDHIKPRVEGGTDEHVNLQPLCKSCHSAKTASENIAARPR